MANIRVWLTGVMGSGKSTFISRFVPDIDIKTHQSMKGPLSKIGSLTDDIYEYDYENYTFIDSPGLYDNQINTHIKSCEFLERILLKIKKMHYVILVINATELGVRLIDLKMLNVLLEFKHLTPKIMVYIAKTDLLDKEQLAYFITQYKLQSQFNKFQVYIPNKHINETRVHTYPNRASITEFNSMKVILDNMPIKPIRTELVELNGHFNISIINEVQKNLIENNRYGYAYAEYGYKLNWFTKLIWGTNEVVTNILVKKFEEKRIRLQVVHLENVSIPNNLTYDIIRYESGKVFYQGTLYGNIFNVGTFFTESGEILYNKEV